MAATENASAFGVLLVQSSDARSFFECLKSELKVKNPKLSYTILAKAWGVSSRSLVSEILNGNRPPSFKVFLKLCRYLKFEAMEKELLRQMLVRDDPKFDRSVDFTKVESTIESLKKKLSVVRTRRYTSVMKPPSIKASDSIELWPRIYSAIGKETTLAEISARVQVSAKKVAPALDAMVEAEFIERIGENYGSPEQYAILHTQLHQKMIEAFIAHEMRNTLSRMSEVFSDSEQLTFGAALMIKKSNLPALKNQLKKLLHQFAAQNYDEDGDTVISLIQLMLK